MRARSPDRRPRAGSEAAGQQANVSERLRPLKAHDSSGAALCRVEDSSHQDDVTVDARGFHDTEATSGPH